MVFEDFDSFFGSRGRNQQQNKQITREELELLKKKAEAFDELKEKYTKLQEIHEELKEELESSEHNDDLVSELQQEKDKYYNAYLRARADLENYKKMATRENERYRSYSMGKILEKLVGHYEDLKRGIKVLKTIEDGDNIEKGFEMILGNLKKILDEWNVKQMNCEGEKFDPYKHEAMMVEERKDLPENTIIEEFDNGYYFNDKILRPAKVKISKKPSDAHGKAIASPNIE